MGINSTFCIIFFCGFLFWLASTEPTQDKLALIDFANNVHHLKPLNWDLNDSACSSWIGITCSLDKSSIVALQLPGFGFEGPIPSNTISRVSKLQILSFNSNNFTGPFPDDFSKLENLANIDLRFNNFEGPLPLDFHVWKNLSVVNLSHNFFNGSIPLSLSNLSYLNVLNLEDNYLSGEIPDLYILSLQFLDLSYNNLTGNVPNSLIRFPSSSFTGNQLSFQVPPPIPDQNPRRKSSKKLDHSAILAIIISCSVMGFVIIVLLMYFYINKNRIFNKKSMQKQQKKEGFIKKEKKAVSNSSNGGGRLVFFEDCNLAFDLEDLLRASAEVLGKGSFGTTYKAALEDGITVAVKRLKEATVAKREFELQMEAIGKIKHENVARIRAYYYSKDEKLMVYDYYGNGSLFTMLHGGKNEEKHVPLDWETRLRFAIGTARGLNHIHTDSSLKLVHGNIKSSNIFLNSQHYVCISDLGLATLIPLTSTSLVRAPGYRAPELTDTRKVSQPSDVYSYGVLLLELLTGKSPIHGGVGDEAAVHLVRWVHSVVHEEWTAEVFDVELLRHPNIEEQMVEMLQIGMSCVSRMPEQRPKMVDVLKMVEDIGSGNGGNLQSTNESTPTFTPMGVDDIASSSNQEYQ